MLASLSQYAVPLIAYGAGLLANWSLLRYAALQSMAARWLAAFAIGYAVFLMAVRLYCHANTPTGVRFRCNDSGDRGLSDVIDNVTNWPDGSTRCIGGGHPINAAKCGASFDASSCSDSSRWPDIGFDIAALDEGAALLLAIVVAVALPALALGLGASLVYLLARMPTLLSDAVAAMAVIGVASRERETWLGAVLRHTWKPSLIAVASLLVVAIALHVAFPMAHTIGEAWGGLHTGIAALSYVPFTPPDPLPVSMSRYSNGVTK